MEASELAGSDRLRQEIRFCTAADGTRIAYATTGHGPPLVRAPNWLTHLEYDCETPLWRHWVEELSKDYRLIRFDQRGCGLSDREVEDISFEAWVSDLEAVVDAVGVDRFPLLGLSQGGAVAIEYAVRHPERVTQLVLYGAFAHGLGRPSRAEQEAFITLVREGWGRDNVMLRQVFTSMFMPTASQAEVQAFNEWERVAVTGEIAARIIAAVASIDVTERLPNVSVPTLVLHLQDDQAVPFSEGRTLASLIPNARLVALEGRDHWLLARHPAWQQLLSEVRAFLASGPGAEEAEAPQPAAAGSTSGLSRRELEVLRLLAAGKSNQQIADELVISLFTVQHHVSNILAKTGLANRTEAAAYAHRSGLA